MAVTIRVPATTANMGPGFDSLGCAFMLYNRVTFDFSDHFSITGCDEEFTTKDNLCYRAFVATCDYAKVAVPTVSLHIDADIPVSSGLGSSASMWVAGAMGADRLLKLSLSKQEIYEIASRLEGHPDNIAPAVFGGLTAALTEDHSLIRCKLPDLSSLEVLCVYFRYPHFDTRIEKSASRDHLTQRRSVQYHASCAFACRLDVRRHRTAVGCAERPSP